MTPIKLPIRGVIAALLLPRNSDDRPLWDSFESNARFLVGYGVAGLCVNGATGEYCGATAGERVEAISRARRIAGAGRVVVSGTGASRWTEAVRFAGDAADAGVDAVLVPVPHFFKYEQQDIAEFYRQVAARARVPVLIYNLPAFTGGLVPELAAELIWGVDGIAGVKDSSGALALLTRLTEREGWKPLRLVGNDSVLAEALEKGLCDGTISGVAGVVPELTIALWRAAEDRDWARLRDLAERYAELVRRLDTFPAPWGLKFIAEARGLAPANPSLPLSAERQAQAEEFRRWFSEWWEIDLAPGRACSSSLTARG